MAGCIITYQVMCRSIAVLMLQILFFMKLPGMELDMAIRFCISEVAWGVVRIRYISLKKHLTKKGI